jgi:hypothetical protein
VLVNAHGFEELENILRGVDYRKLAPYLFQGIMSGDKENLWFLHGCMFFRVVLRAFAVIVLVKCVLLLCSAFDLFLRIFGNREGS